MRLFLTSLFAVMFVAGNAFAGFITGENVANYDYPTASGSAAKYTVSASTTVNTAGLVIESADSTRKKMYVVNPSTNAVYYTFSTVASTTAFAAADQGYIAASSTTASEALANPTIKEMNGFTGGVTFWGNGETLDFYIETFSN